MKQVRASLSFLIFALGLLSAPGLVFAANDHGIIGKGADYDHLIASNRQWLAHLTTETAKKIAYQNAEGLFGRKIGTELFGTR